MPGEEFKFSYILSDDRTTAKILLNGKEYLLKVREINALTHFLALRRDEMQPEVPIEISQCAPQEIFQADSISVSLHPESKTAQVFLRIPGIGWAHAEFPPEDCLRLSEMLFESSKNLRIDNTKH